MSTLDSLFGGQFFHTVSRFLTVALIVMVLNIFIMLVLILLIVLGHICFDSAGANSGNDMVAISDDCVGANAVSGVNLHAVFC